MSRQVVFLLAQLALLCVVPLAFASDNPVAGSCALTTSSQLGTEVQVSLRMSLVNQTGGPVIGAMVSLEHAEALGPPLDLSSPVDINPRASKELTWNFVVSQLQLDAWQQAGQLRLRFEYNDRLHSGREVVDCPASIEEARRGVPSEITVQPTSLASPPVGSSIPIITTVAGGGPNHLPALESNIYGANTVLSDPSGNVYILVWELDRLFKVDPDGLLTIVAGQGANSLARDNVPAVETSLNGPADMIIDSSGNIYITAPNANRVRRIDANTGIITAVFGTGIAGSTGDGGPASNARLNLPWGLGIDTSDNIYITELHGHRIRRVSASTGIITTVAGNGVGGFAGDGGPASSAKLNFPGDVEIDRHGNLLIVDRGNSRIRRVSAETGVITTVAGTGTNGFGGDGGQATAAQLYFPSALAIDSSGSFFIADSSNNRIRRVDSVTGIINTIAGDGSCDYRGDGGPATAAALCNPRAIALTPGSELIIGDSGNYRVRRVDAFGMISTIAGNGTIWYSGDGYAATQAALAPPFGVARAPDGGFVIADGYNHRIRRVDGVTGIITTIAGSGLAGFGGDGGPATAASLNEPRDMAFDSAGNLFIADTANHRIRRVDAATGVITTLAGTGAAGFGGDGGPAIDALLSRPDQLTVDAVGGLIISEPDNHRVRIIDLRTGRIDSIAGTGRAGYNGDARSATTASLNSPTGVAVDPMGNVHIADLRNQRVRRIDSATGLISTVVGNGVDAYHGDGGLAVHASLSDPSGVDFDLHGDLLIAVNRNQRVRVVDHVTRVIRSVAGGCILGGLGPLGDGGPAVEACLNSPYDVAVEASGNVLISVFSHYRIRRIVNPPDGDRDGLPDVDEGSSHTDPADPDSDDDGLLDGFEALNGFDPLLGGEEFADPDADGLNNLQEQALKTNPHLADTDGDGLNDGQEFSIGTSPHVSDTDRDFATDKNDNCPLVQNQGQEDRIHPNGVGDACDDPDGDSVFDEADNCPDTQNHDQEDGVHPNSVGDACEDLDADGIFDATDNCPDTSNAEQLDRDVDGAGDPCDICADIFNPGQNESVACVHVTAPGGECLDVNMGVIGEGSGERIELYDVIVEEPASITLEFNMTSCTVAQPVDIFLNGVLLRSLEDELFSCTCVSPPQALTIDDSDLLRSIWNIEGGNELRVRKESVFSNGPEGGSFVHWIRARIEGGGAVSTSCLYDALGGDCSEANLCDALFAETEPFLAELAFEEPLSRDVLVSSADVAGADFPAFMDLRAVRDGRAKACLVAESASLYASTRDGELLTIDPDSGATRFLGLLPTWAEEIEFDELTGRAFVQAWGASFGHEFRIADAAGVGQDIFNGRLFDGLEYVGATLYGVATGSPGPSQLRVLAPFTGISTFVGTTGTGPIAGLAYDHRSRIMYGIKRGVGPSDLLIVDLATGQASLVGTRGLQAGSLEFGPDGHLYAGSTGSEGGRLYRIDPATGATTLVAETPYSSLTGLMLVRRVGADCASFNKLGEKVMAVNGATCGPPRAEAGPDIVRECVASGATVTLDGSGSGDPKTQADPNSRVVLFEWFEDLGTTSERPLGTSEVVEVTLPLGEHRISLRVTDTFGMTSVDEVMTTVEDTAPPSMAVHRSPAVLWPPNHRMVPVTFEVAAQDLCDPAPLVDLASVTSSEPDDAAGNGDGHTVDDIQDVQLGPTSTTVHLRAERSGPGPGRLYRTIFTATDKSGNPAIAETGVLVPHEQGGSSEPVQVEIARSATGTASSLRWSAIPGATSYNVLRGSISEVSSIGSFTVAQNTACLGRALTTTALTGAVLDEDPGTGEAFFYLVEYFDGRNSGYGSTAGGGEVVIISGDSCH